MHVVICFQRRARIAFSDDVHTREELLGEDAHTSEDQVRLNLSFSSWSCKSNMKHWKHKIMTTRGYQALANRPMDDINPLDVTVAYVSVINESKTIKGVGYLGLGYLLFNGEAKAGTLHWSQWPWYSALAMTFRSLWWSDDFSVLLLYGISFAKTDDGQ